MSADALVPDPEVAKEFSVTLMTLWRWDRSPTRIADGWPPAIKIKKRNYRSRNGLETFKKNLIDAALAERDAILAKEAARA